MSRGTSLEACSRVGFVVVRRFDRLTFEVVRDDVLEVRAASDVVVGAGERVRKRGSGEVDLRAVVVEFGELSFDQFAPRGR